MKLTFFYLLLLFTSCGNKQKKYTYIVEEGSIFNTYYSIKYSYSHSLKNEIEQEFTRFDDSLNPFKDGSVITKVNINESVILDDFFIAVFKRSKEIYEATDGLFDITLAPLINAWGFGFKNMEQVTPQIIDSLMQIKGLEKITLKDGKIVKQDSRIEINTSGIAKGYSVDVIAKLLESYGISDYLIEIGGEIRAKGFNAQSQCWQIGIDRPIDDSIAIERPLINVVKLCDKAIATSGNYRNFYEKDGKKYAHTINPHTGYPSENYMLSATVIADDCMTADAFATAFMLADTATVRGIAKRENLSYMLIMAGDKDSEYRIITSTDFDNYLTEQ